MITLQEITEELCRPAQNSRPAKVKGHDVRVCLYNADVYCPYRHERPELSYCLL
jgi:hypothetical protein